MKDVRNFESFVRYLFPRIPGSHGSSQVALAVKNQPANAGDVRDGGWTPGLGRSPGGGHGNPLQYCCLENPTDREAWRATVHIVANTWTRLRSLSTHAGTGSLETCYFSFPSGRSLFPDMKSESLGLTLRNHKSNENAF